VFPGRRQRFSSWIAAALVLAVAAACAGPAPDPEPWNRAVDGSAGVTEWESNGTPSSPYGPGGFDWESAEQLMGSLGESLQGQGIEVEHALVPGDDPDLVVGWLRITNLGDDAIVAGDLRLRIERDDGTWAATLVEQRSHCRFEPEGTECTEPGRPAPVETSAPAESGAPP